MWKLSPHILIPYIMRVAIVVIAICVTVQAHCVYKPHRYFISYLFPEKVTSRQQFESRVEKIGVNEVIELQCKSFQHTLMRAYQTEQQSGELVSDKDRDFLLFCEMEDGIFLVKQTALDLKNRSARVTVDFGNMGEDLSNAIFMADGTKLFLSPQELARRLVHFSFIEQSFGDVALLAGMYLFFGFLLPVGYVVIQMRSLDLRRFLQLVWADRPGKVIILLLLVVVIALNLFIYLDIHDINSFKGGKWRNPKKHTDDFNRVLEMVEEEPPLDTLARLKIEHQNFLSSFLQEEITTPVEVLRETGTKNNTMLKQVYGLLFFDQAGERKIFRLTGKDFENLYAHSHNASIVCLKPHDTAYDSEVFLSSEGLTGQRESRVWQRYITAQWVAQNKLSEITSEISIIANCENKTVFWLFGRKYYVAYPMKKYTDMFNKKSKI